MKTSKVSLLQDMGNEYMGKHQFRVTMEDNTTGMAWSVNKTPPYAEGDEVEYEVKGEDKSGNTKLSVKKLRKDGPVSSASSNAVGQRIGNAVTNAVNLTIHGVAPWNKEAHKKLSDHILALAYSITLVGKKLEEGWTPGGTAKVEEPKPQPPVQARPAKPEPGPGGLAFNPKDVEEDVPF